VVLLMKHGELGGSPLSQGITVIFSHHQVF